MVLTRSRWDKLFIFLEMIKFEHSIFALPFAYLGLLLGEGGWPRTHLLFWVTIAMVSFRTAGMSLNRLIDSSIDAQNPRTQNRALPTGKIDTAFVWKITFAALALFELSAFQLGKYCFLLSPLPVLLTWLYPFAKRFTWFSHFILGIILGMSPYGAWLASRGEFSWIPGLVMIGVAAWVAGFDMIYALQDMEFDRLQGLYSFPARFGSTATLRLTQILHVITFASWLAAGLMAGLGTIYILGMMLVGFFLIREHWLIRSFGLEKIQEAFFTMNAIVSILLFLSVAGDVALRSLLV